MTGDDRRQASPVTGGRIFLNCRACWARIQLEPHRAAIVDGRPVYRCQSCDTSFLIRWDDAAALGVAPGPDPDAATA